MTKVRVYELSKELGMENKEVIEILKSKNVEVKSHSSSVSEEVAAELRAGKKPAVPKAVAAKEAEEKMAEKAETVEPKKKELVRVFRPQNSASGARSPRPSGQRPRANGDRPMRPRADGDRPMRPRADGDRPMRPRVDGDRPMRPRADGDRPVRPRVDGDRPVRPRVDGDRPVRPRADGDRPARPRVDGDRPARPRTDGDRPARPRADGDRPVRPRAGGDRPVRPRANNERSTGQRPRPTGDQSQGQRSMENRKPRPQGQGGYQGNKPQENRSQGQGNRPQGNRPGGQGQNFNRGGRPGGPGGPRRDDKDGAQTPAQSQSRNPRNKVKEKEKEFKKNEIRNESFGNKPRRGKRPNEVKKPPIKVEKAEEKIKEIIIPELLTIKELADAMKVVPSVIVKKLFLQGKIVTVNQEINFETAEEIAMEFEVLCEKEVVVDVIEELLKEEAEDEGSMEKRPPVVCVMGHVDHGKTSLLDAIRDANQTDREAGGITQHIGAYTVKVHGEKITFLDTPGHEAFTSMRMRGANSTDIAILVVAADDGVMPQTVEAISHAKDAGVEIIVAINKIDKPGANIERVKQELTEYELVSEDWGGTTTFVPVSAKTRDGITELLEMIILTSEVLELKSNSNRAARGLVVESLLDKGKGSVATVLVQKGTLRVGDSIAAGSAYGKVRAMVDDKGRRLKEAGPSQPVEILGLNGVPNAGEIFVGCDTEKDARSFAETFISHNRVKLLDDTKSKMSLDDLFTQIHEGNLKELKIIVKADVQGSVEALKQNLLKLSNEEVVIKVIHGGVGAINESDVILASTSNAIIIGFNVRPDVTAKEIADTEGVDLRLYKVIYSAIEDVAAAMKGMLDPIFEEKVLGHAEIRQIFKASGIGNIAGSYVLDGIFERGCKVRITREGALIFEGGLASLKRFKDDVKEVRAGYECGLVFTDFNDVKEEDKVEAYKMVEVERK
ncbi:MAG: translation initiation factor IF-2 [Lachnospiraceae bacterium]|nr:translation initiation factor IF-2 [Lachnospiraceae bacterium]